MNVPEEKSTPDNNRIECGSAGQSHPQITQINLSNLCNLWINKPQLGGVAKDQPIEIGVVSQWVQVVIVLRTHTQVRLQVECALK
jgi:hypothetical protein